MTQPQRWGVALLLVGTLIVFWTVAASPSEAPSGADDVPHAETSTVHVAATDEVSGCPHPFVPTMVGAWREYRWESTEDAGTVRLRLESTRRVGAGSVLGWVAQAGARVLIDRRCGPDGAEEPWVALGATPGIEFVDQTWRVPRRITVGDVYVGELSTRILGFDVRVTRRHHVRGRERVRAAGRDYLAWRIEVEDQTDASTPIPSTQWLAEGVGLVQLWLGPEEHRTEVRLTAAGP